MEGREMEPRIEMNGDLPRHLWLRALTAVAPGFGRRRVWDKLDDLEGQLMERDLQLAAKDREIEKLRSSLGASERFVDHLLNQHVDMVEMVSDLEGRLSIAIAQNESNARMIDFDFHERLITDNPLDQPTGAISIEELREDLSRDEPIIGKVLQVNPETGLHETVETPLEAVEVSIGPDPEPDQVESPDLIKLREAIEGQGHRLSSPERVTKPVIIIRPYSLLGHRVPPGVMIS